jgi:hypothetical protein
MVPVYLITNMLAPLGLILYTIIRAIKTRSWFAASRGSEKERSPASVGLLAPDR